MSVSDLTTEQFDATVGLACQRFAAVMESLVTPQSSLWAMLKPVDKVLHSYNLAAGTYERYVRSPGETDPAKAISHESGSFGVEDALREEIRDFVRSVREKRPPLVSGRDGLRAIEVAEQVVADARRRLQKLAVQG